MLCTNSNLPRPPRPPHRGFVRISHGERREDPYAWLEDPDDPSVIEHLHAENAYADEVLGHTRKLRETLYEEFRRRINEDDVSVPVAMDGWLYFTRMRAGLEYPVHCRKRDRADAEEEIVLDVNCLAKGHDYYELGALEVSPDHRLLLYAEDVAGDERYRLGILDLQTRSLLEGEIKDVDDAIWMQDGRRLLYTRLDASQRPFEVWLHCVGHPVGQDRLLYREEDPAFFLHLDRSRDRQYLFIASESHVTSEVRFIAANASQPRPRLFRRRQPGVEYALEHRGGEFFVLTNLRAPNFRLLRASVGPCDERACRELVSHDEAVKFEGMDVFADHLLTYIREHGLCGVRVCDLRSGEWHTVAFEEPLLTVSGGDNPTFHTDTVRLVLNAYTTPTRVYDYHLAHRTFELKKQVRVRGRFDPAHYLARRVYATAADGTAVPVSIVHRQDLDTRSPAPCLLVGYGAYGASLDPVFSAARLSLLDRGFVYAEAHVRGGGELGERWRDAGRLARKNNTFDDFIAAAEYLTASGVTAPGRLAIMGGSAGGLLVGAALNRRPKLFAAAVTEVPFVDVLNTMLDPELPLTVIEYDEWGDPRREADYRRIRDYAPYEQVRPQAYPALLVLAGLNDTRVQYWEAAKWVARLRELSTGSEPVLLQTQMSSGHGGASGRYQALRELALEYAFIVDRVGDAR